MTEREVFITLCLLAALSDKAVSEHEQETVDMILQRYGYSREELEEVIAALEAMNQYETMLYMVKVLGAATELPLDRKESLMNALCGIAMADDLLRNGETDFIETLEGILLSHT